MQTERVIYPELFEQDVPGVGRCTRIQTPLKARQLHSCHVAHFRCA